jgi:proteasome alpha subunit
VEICVAEVGATPADDELYRLTYDGSVGDEPGYIAMGGQTEPISTMLKEHYRDDLTLREALELAVKALGNVGAEGGVPRQLPATQLEVAVLDRKRLGRAFRRITGVALAQLLPAPEPAAAPEPAEKEPAAKEPEAAEPAAAPAEPGDAPKPTAKPPKANNGKGEAPTAT